MEAVGLFFVYALTAIFLENVVLTRILGVGRITFNGSLKNRLVHGVSLTVVTTLSSMLCYAINFYLYDFKVLNTYRAFLYLVCVCVVYAVLYLLWGYFMRNRLPEVLRLMPLSAFNCAVLGALILSVTTQHSFAGTVGFAVGTGVGYTLALFLIETGQTRLELIRLPRAFRGMPIMLLYIGIVSLSIYGLIGHQLPT